MINNAHLVFLEQKLHYPLKQNHCHFTLYCITEDKKLQGWSKEGIINVQDLGIEAGTFHWEPFYHSPIHSCTLARSYVTVNEVELKAILPTCIEYRFATPAS